METPAPAPAEVLSTKKIQAAVEQFTRALAAGGGVTDQTAAAQAGQPGPSRTAGTLIRQPETLVILERVEANPFGLRGE
ncbi:hypothetical protein [Streptomyces anulatus]|uniref:hypothetical protein n=1 Tax=Streptomyces anulatus TaxID=1892 RepID=UPI002E0F10FC|nr:hypothetical protein OG274_00125 [Streptomyces anulatus]